MLSGADRFDARQSFITSPLPFRISHLFHRKERKSYFDCPLFSVESVLTKQDIPCFFTVFFDSQLIDSLRKKTPNTALFSFLKQSFTLVNSLISKTSKALFCRFLIKDSNQGVFCQTQVIKQVQCKLYEVNLLLSLFEMLSKSNEHTQYRYLISVPNSLLFEILMHSAS